MGNASSGPSAPTVVEQPPPAGSGENSIVYPDTPNAPRLTGLTRSLANDCAKCSFQVVPGISSSSVKLTREFGAVSEFQCRKYDIDLKRVKNKEMSLQNFLGKLQTGGYLRNLDNGFCEQVELPDSVAKETTTIDKYDESKLRTVRIQPVESAGFSASTKAKFTPSIPFKLVVNGLPITVNTMTLYHPSPLRVEDVQADAVLSLNDPSFGNPGVVILIPLVGRNTDEPSTKFFEKIAPEIVSVASENPASGQYLTRDISTGANWSLSKLFSVEAGESGNLDIASGYYVFSGMPPLERKRRDGSGTVTYSWERSGKTSPNYVVLDTPVAINSSDLATITQRLPVTPSMDAIHAVLYDNNNPLNRGIVHKQGRPVSAQECSKKALYREMFDNADLNGVTNESCDAWETWAQRSGTTDDLIAVLLGVILTIAAAIGAYLALVAVSKLYDVELRGIAEVLGKITAVFAKNLNDKVAKVQNAVGNIRSAATNPKGFAMNTAQSSLQSRVGPI